MENFVTNEQYLQALKIGSEYYKKSQEIYSVTNSGKAILQMENPSYSEYEIARKTIIKYNEDSKKLAQNHQVKPISSNLIQTLENAKKLAFTFLLNCGLRKSEYDSFFTNQEINLLSSIFWYLKTEKPYSFTIQYAFNMIMDTDIQNVTPLLDDLSYNSECENLLKILKTDLSVMQLTLSTLKIRFHRFHSYYDLVY